VLILTRRVGENVIVGDDIVISVLEVRGDAVRIGVQAPRSVSVHREEVWLELQRANEKAASPDDAAVAELGSAVANQKADNSGTKRSGPRRD
jgi:carbon storage regulator